MKSKSTAQTNTEFQQCSGEKRQLWFKTHNPTDKCAMIFLLFVKIV